ncbi:hypothetical protein KEJ27_03390 [Candidatus Bathyarchaeota archaeon]|nr:hypothetical protein [Candidatus Bathyarchaeota archaeon]
MKLKIQEKIIPVLKRAIFLNSWKETFATTSYSEDDKERVIEQLEKILLILVKGETTNDELMK